MTSRQVDWLLKGTVSWNAAPSLEAEGYLASITGTFRRCKQPICKTLGLIRLGIVEITRM